MYSQYYMKSLNFHIIILCPLTAIYFEVLLCTTCKVVNYMNNVNKIIHN